MFGLSATKLLLLALVIAAVWYGYKHLTGSDAAKDKVGAKPDADPVPGSEPGAIEDMVRCPACGAYRASGIPACSTPGCSGKA
ncbi:MAG: hypothetical protein JNM30_21060 [Rhodospirillales bacterium]|nr:hypothetical protein [Rhodospirillales bacterium]